MGDSKIEQIQQAIKNLDTAIPLLMGYRHFHYCDQSTPAEKINMDCRILICPHRVECAAFREGMQNGRFVKAVALAANCCRDVRSMWNDQLIEAKEEQEAEKDRPLTLDFPRYSQLRDMMTQYNDPNNVWHCSAWYYNEMIRMFSEEEISYMSNILAKKSKTV